MIPLPTLNAIFNATSCLFLIAGYRFIRAKRIKQHKFCMLGAVTASVLFFCTYLYYHYHAGSRPFTGSGWLRTFYFAILLSHTVLAVVNVPFVIVTLARAFKEKFDQHGRIARWTFPLWMYVSITGVIVYFMLYHL